MVREKLFIFAVMYYYIAGKITPILYKGSSKIPPCPINAEWPCSAPND